MMASLRANYLCVITKRNPENLNESIGELQIPYQITQAFECVDAMIHNQVMA